MYLVSVAARSALLLLAALCVFPSSMVAQVASPSSSRPLPPDYRIHADGSVTQRICFNWSCSLQQRLTFSASDMANVARQMSYCPADSMSNRMQRMRIGVWQMENLAQKYQPLLANDTAINEDDADFVGRMDCIDNVTNTQTYLSILRDLGLLSGWSIVEPQVRDQFSLDVHWTAVVVDSQSSESWSVDSWFRANGNLPYLLPLNDWSKGETAWEAPYTKWNTYPRYTHELCGIARPTYRAPPPVTPAPETSSSRQYLVSVNRDRRH